jgi:hypothetical protein
VSSGAFDSDAFRYRRPGLALAIFATVAAVILAGTVTAFALAPRLRYWNCREPHERPTARAAIDAYYRNCWTQPKPTDGPWDFQKAGSEYGNWYEVKQFWSDDSGLFLNVGRKTAASGWIVLGEGTGP